MRINKIEISNYRLLKDFDINLEENLSLVIGKNNTGKTSFLSVLERFLTFSKDRFSFEDINLESKQSFKEKFIQDNFEEEYSFGITLKLYIHYDEEDNLSNISEVMLNLEPDQNVVVIEFSYSILYEEIQRLKKDFTEFKKDYAGDPEKDILFYLAENYKSYFAVRRRALEYKNEENTVSIEEQSTIDKIINFKRIKAKRDVVDTDGYKTTSDKTLSRKSSRFYNKISSPEVENENIRRLNKELRNTDKDLDEVYTDLFAGLLDKVKRFGGIKENESKLEIKSKLEGRNLLKDNTSVMYSQEEQTLPEDYYGLGYLNLISMIFEIEVILNDFKRKTSETEVPSDINLFFIEEPEAHTHPQMQYIFIKNIKDLLEEERNGEEDGIEIDLQTIISTHSSHITAESEFDDIKYFDRTNVNSVISKDLKQLEGEYDEDSDQYEFLKKYLTLSRSELFFADKAILIEGDTERLLIPSIMRKMDNENQEDKLPLLSQNISIIQAGAYAHIFDKFIDFLDIKTLIITDIDSVHENGKCPVEEGAKTSNNTIKSFLGKEELDELVDLRKDERCLSKEEDGWQNDNSGDLLIVYQKKEDEYHPRSFEDAFINKNLTFIQENKDSFYGLKKADKFDNEQLSSFELAENCINKKTDFALDIIYHSNDAISNWDIPSYIEEGLTWLKQ
ncbi:Predicted ATP-dependent endonuclease of the OLD family, contains P-loop ATPase and TOPRIM domains [Fodinibius roseus]|uniref:Predicted ATP-dependent endonuclease of the OLD family, contains P-loop ATPase and TOPRIM domains n=1 Tax=Fodinibius roseus TaxID=1194090 RepID=A0A1M5LRE7_9BACT|nr:ATP-dependent endonuclease [Fodinibius roseus]SHG67618.1 Predicted ATP-dependent endonuclease of the OLD family, contains P-loop ATPase and TOPRIM domains [Fodinibius roseus]